MPALVGRGAEREQLRSRLVETAQGRLQVVLLEGVPGIGKSVLLDWILREAQATGFRVFKGRGQELQIRRPFGILIEALASAGSWSGDTSREPDMFSRESSPRDELGAGHFRMAESLARVIEEESLTTPVLLALDDLHWSDVSSIQMLATLPERLTYSSLMLAGTLRPAPRSRELEDLITSATESGGRLIRVGPLPDPDVRQLVEKRVAAAAGPLLLSQVGRAAGNPLLIREVIDSLEREQLIEISEGIADARQSELPRDLSLTVLRRISFLSQETISLLRLASVLGSSFTPDVLAAVVGKGATEILPAVDEAIRSEIFVEDGDDLRFRHDLIREALYDDIPLPMRKSLHTEIAGKLQSRSAPESQVAEHYALGASPGDREAIAALRAAARSTLAPATRASLLRQAYELALPGSIEIDETGVELVEALIWAGALSEGETLADELLSRVDDAVLVQKLWENKLRSLYLQSRWQDVIELTTERLSLSDSRPTHRAIWLAHRAIALVLSTVDLAQGTEDARAALVLTESSDRDRERLLALDALTLASEMQHRRAESIPFGQQASEIAASSTDPDVQRLHTDVWYALSLTNAGRQDEGLRMLQDRIRQRLESGVVWDVPLYHDMIGHTYWAIGKWEDAIAELEAALSSAEEIGTRVFEALTRLRLAKIAFHQDRLSDAAEQIRLIKTIHSDLGPQWGDPRGLEATLLAARGDNAAALAQMASLVREKAIVISGNLIDWIPIIDDEGESDLAREALAVNADQVGSETDPRTVAVEAFVKRDLRGLQEAIDLFEAIPEWWSAVAKELAARVLAQEDRPEEARTMALSALETYEGLGAEYLVRRCSGSMRARGIRVSRITKGRRPAVGWESLTDAELRVARLTTEGLTNSEIGDRLFISRHTVQTHLKHVFAKLQISSRVQLAGKVAQHADVPRT